jgi:hypothetical protein
MTNHEAGRVFCLWFSAINQFVSFGIILGFIAPLLNVVSPVNANEDPPVPAIEFQGRELHWHITRT